MFGYPLTGNTYAKLYWDYFQKTGHGYGGEYSYFRPDVKGSIYTYRIEDRLAQNDRWNFKAGHWQQVKPRLALQANAYFQSDKNFNTRYYRLWGVMEQTGCRECGQASYSAGIEDERTCPRCGAKL